MRCALPDADPAAGPMNGRRVYGEAHGMDGQQRGRCAGRNIRHFIYFIYKKRQLMPLKRQLMNLNGQSMGCGSLPVHRFQGLREERAQPVARALARAGSAGFQPARGRSPRMDASRFQGDFAPLAGWKPALPARARASQFAQRRR